MCRFKYTVDVPRLFALWNDRACTRVEIARELGLTETQLRAAAQRHGLGPRGRCHRAFSMLDDANPEHDTAEDSLAFSPWVAQRIKELQIGLHA